MKPSKFAPAVVVSRRRSHAVRPHSLALGRACAAAALAAVVLLAALPAASRADGVRETHPNLMGGEILGRGLVATFNYERFLNNHFGLGAGAMAIVSSDGTVGVAPLYASWLPGNIHSLYLGVGAAYVGSGGDLQTYSSTWVMQYTAGYQFHSPNGFWVRPTLTLNVDTERSRDLLIWPGVGVGGSF